MRRTAYTKQKDFILKNRFIQAFAIIGGAVLALFMLMGHFDTVHSQTTPAIELGITPSDSAGPIDVATQGDMITYTVVMSITGDFTSTAFISGTMSLTNTLPTGVVYDPGSVTGGGGYNPATHSITHTVISPTGSISNVMTTTTIISITYAVRVDANPGTILHNRIVISTADGFYEAVSMLPIVNNEIDRKTIVVAYAPLDNNLCSEKAELIDKFERSAHNENVTILLLVDCNDTNREDAFYYLIQPDTVVGEEANYQLGVNKWRWSENLASPLSLYSFVTGAIKAYPNHDQVVLSLIGHGSGWGAGDFYIQEWTYFAPSGTGYARQPRAFPGQSASFLFDDSAQDGMSVRELGVALEWITESIGGEKLDLIYMDNCSMQMFEVAYEIRKYAKYLLGSANTAWAAFPYDAHIAAIDGSADALTIARRWLNNEAKVLRETPGHPFTLSIIDLSKMEALRDKVDVLAGELLDNFDENTKSLLQDAFVSAIKYESYYNSIIDIRDHYVDLFSFAQQLIGHSYSNDDIDRAAQAVQAAVEDAVIVKDYQSGYPWLKLGEYWGFDNHYGSMGIYSPFPFDLGPTSEHNEARRPDYSADYLESARGEDGWDDLVAKFWEGIDPPEHSRYCGDEFDCEPGKPEPMRPVARPPYLSIDPSKFSILFDADRAIGVNRVEVKVDFSNTCLSLNTVPTGMDSIDEILRFTVTSPEPYGELTQLDLDTSACLPGTTVPLTVKSISTKVDGTVLDEVTAVGYVQVPGPVPCETIVVDNADIYGVEVISPTHWITSTAVSGFHNDNYYHNNSGVGSVKYMAPCIGEYEVLIRWTEHPNRATNTPIYIVHSDGTETIIKNQKVDGGQWISLGLYAFGPGDYVEIGTDNTDGFVISDAVRFMPATECSPLHVDILDDAIGSPGESVAISVKISQDVANCQIYAFAFTVTADGSVLVPRGIFKNGTMSENGIITVNNDVPGQIRVVGFSTTPLAGSGDLIHLLFDVVGDVGSESALTFSNFQFNEGEPLAQTDDGHFIIQREPVIYGCVSYQVNGLLIQDVKISFNNVTANTGQDGCYEMPISTNSGIAIPSKIGDIGNALTVDDAIEIALYVAGSRTFDGLELQACDVTGDETCTALDAAEIARYIVGLDPIEEETRVGEWVFDPPNLAYPESGNPSDYTAFIMGDVTFDWSMPSQIIRAAQSDTIVLNIPSIKTASNREVILPISVQNISGKGLRGYQISIYYDPSAITIDGVFQGNIIPSAWSLTTNLMDEVGELHIVSFGVDRLEDDGNLLNLSISMKGESGTQTELTVSNPRFNGEHAVRSIGGNVQIDYMNYMPIIAR